MKKLLLLTILLAVTAAAMPQERVLLPKEKINYGIKTNWEVLQNKDNTEQGISPWNYKSTAVAPSEHVIGNTFYDLQTNRALQNRIYRYDDGSIGAVWTRGMDDSPNFPDRGTGYNYYNGSEWGPMPETRIESSRTGWPCYAPLGTNGELIICHDNTLMLYILKRDSRGYGEWTENYFTYSLGPELLSHPRIITAGPDHNSIHLLSNTFDEYMGQTHAIVYSRSQDGGLSWNIENELLNGTGIDDYNSIYIDSYVWADERNGTIAFLCGSAWYDMFIMKSTDDGDTWEKTVIWEHPYPFFDWNSTITDTFFCMDNSASIALDSEGKAHVTFGINRVLHDTPGNSYWLFAYVDGIGYWNEDMEPFSNDLDALSPPEEGYANSEMIVDYNYIGWMQDVNGNGTIDLNDNIRFYMELGASTMPNISIDDQDRIFVLYASTTETYEYEVYNFKHIWGRAFENGSWGLFLDLSEDIVHVFDECIYPQIASSSDENIHYIYNIDEIPGTGFNNHHSYIENKIIYGALPKSGFLTGINDHEGVINRSSHLSVYPNPAAGIINLSFSIDNLSPVEARLMNTQGLLIESINLGKRDAGMHSASLNLSHLPDGVYLLRLHAGETVETVKLVITK